ncbi:NAD(+) diphosphatase [Cellvibrio sp. NN19]|uniref:NAD(+) diphosphatase n=1 Tax=Cellvibrio chitinivorans TaxID=3102792 RepID=UPI002B40FF57|nr:NAD(+) diphosphatase [Cellvibrio sp. NN19]
MSFRFDLASFEFHASVVAPVVSRNRRFIIVGTSPNYRSDQLLCDAEGYLFLAQESHLFSLKSEATSEHYLGVLNGEDLWVRVFAEAALPETYQWRGLRSQLELLSPEAFQLAGRALQIAQWFYDHRFCGRCGQKTTQDHIDRAKVCIPCDLRFYPRLSPCMIVLVTRGDELLLAHHQRASRVMYSTLAGFVEAGESVEDCVKREVMEEVGIRVDKLEYFRSQPWPFPGQLMLGFFAEYAAGEIQIDPTEIVDAKWFRYDQLPQTPAPASVAGQLIAHYVKHMHQLHKQ